MKLLKVILFIFVVYFVRRFFQLYKAIKNTQENQVAQNKAKSKTHSEEKIVDADFRVLD